MTICTRPMPPRNLRHTGVLNDQAGEPGKALSTHADARGPLQRGQGPVRFEVATQVDVQVVTIVAVAIEVLLEPAYALKVRTNVAVKAYGVLPSNSVGVQAERGAGVDGEVEAGTGPLHIAPSVAAIFEIVDRCSDICWSLTRG